MFNYGQIRKLGLIWDRKLVDQVRGQQEVK